MGRFEQRRALFEKAGVTLVAISVDPVERSQALAKRLGLHYRILSDPSGDVIRAYGVQHAGKGIALPAVFVIGPDGRVVWRRVSETIMDRPSEAAILQIAQQARLAK